VQLECVETFVCDFNVHYQISPIKNHFTNIHTIVQVNLHG
jgi:hypothetical protein